MKTKFNGILTLLLALVVQISFAQDRTISGVVSDETGPLPGVTVLKKGTTQGTETDFNGKYTIKAKSGDVLVFSFIGMKTVTRTVGGNSVISFVMENDNVLDEVVVTGVASGTSTKKLGFTLTKVDDELLENVPAVDASNALRGKVAGINISQSQGDGSATVTLRGAKSVFGNTSPLILVDGIISNQTLGDINTSDIASVEVIKGAAASSLYGSRAAGGVIQIITKKGKKGAQNFSVSVRSEIGFNDIERPYEQNTKHGYKINSDGTLALDASGKAELDLEHGKFDRDYSALGLPLNNVIDRATTNAFYKDNTFSATGGGETYRFYGSAQIQDKGGLLSILPSDKRTTLRANFDVEPTDKLKIGFRSSYTNNKVSPITDYNVARGGQGSLFEILLRYEPFVDVLERDADGDYAVVPSGAYIQGADNAINPFYKYSQIRQENENDRFVMGIQLEYELAKDLNLKVAGATDKYYSKRFQYYPKGYKTAAPNPDLNDGQLLYNNFREDFNSASVQLNYGFDITSDLKANFTAKYLVENQTSEQVRVTGSKLTVDNVYNLTNTDPSQRTGFAYRDEINSQNFFLNGDFDYKDKIIVSGLIRRDGSSLFGANEKWQTYYRGSIAYRLTQDLEINGIQELKLRASYGTAGRRPGFRDQYERANADATGITFNQSGNPDLKPSVNKEFETGFDVQFLDKFNLSATYSNSIIENDFINRTLPSSTSLFNSQTQNLGAVKATTVEVSLGANIIENEKFSWDANLTFDTSTSKVTDLGDILPFTNGLYRVEKDVEIGTMYGNYAFTSLDELEFDTNGVVTNAHNVSTDGLTRDDFVVNNMGYVVEKSTVGTKDEQAVFWKDKNGNRGIRAIGNSIPNFKMGLANTFKFGKNFTVYALFDYKNGGQTYNSTEQYLVFNGRSKMLQEASEKGHHFSYVQNANSIYNSNSFANTFVENSDYLKLRELAASYTLNKENLGGLFEEVKLSLIGRNLITWTNYTGYNPEVGRENFSYPIYRTFSFAVNVKF